MSKKKVVLIVASLCMVLMLAIGGTIAYFTDTDEATNTFTVGNVKIDLIEQQRSEDGKTLVDFTQNKVLMPIVGSAQGDKVSLV
jgi:predicted ribosomally synthesized peptide with SipW-like signal peptide